MTKLLDKRRDEAAVRQIFPRVIVVTDSDGEWVGDVKPHAQELRQQCAASDIPCPPLHKRTAENYIPDGVWQAWVAEHPQEEQAIRALLHLSSRQRDHVNIGKANAEPWDSSKPEVRALFADVPQDDQSQLRAASLKGRKSRAISHILQKFGAGSDRDELSARDHQNDLFFVVQRIKDEL